MRLLDAKSSHWAVRHVYAIMAPVGLIMLAISWQVILYLAGLLDSGFSSSEYHVFLLAWYASFALLIVGAGLVAVSPVLAVGYWLIRRGITFKLKGPNVD